LGGTAESLIKILKGKDPLCLHLIKAKNPIILLGIEQISIKSVIDSLNILINKIPNCKLGYIHTNISNINRAEIGIDNSIIKSRVVDNSIIFNLGNEINQYDNGTFNIYIGHHPNGNLNQANLILPGSTFIEKDSTYLNIEGRIQETRLINLPPELAREDFKIFNAIKTNLSMLRPTNAGLVSGPSDGQDNNPIKLRFYQLSPHLLDLGKLPQSITIIDILSKPFRPLKIKLRPFKKLIKNYLLTDPLSKNSKRLCIASIENSAPAPL